MKNTLKQFFQYFMSTVQVVFAVLMIILVIFALFRAEMVQGWIDIIGVHIKSWGNWNYVVLFLTAMAESIPFIGAALPGINIIIMVGGFFILRQWDIFPYAVAIAMTGAICGNAFGYFMGKYGNRKMLSDYMNLVGIDVEKRNWLEDKVHKYGSWLIIGGKFHSLTRSFIPLLAGMHDFAGMKFWVANIIGSFLWAIVVLLFGIFFVENYVIILRNISYIFGAALII